jgi:glycine/D-amino acid oxidase-like deaminating enzyme
MESAISVKPTVLVVGAGVLGCNLAHELTRLGAKVTLVDAGGPASGASGATFGWVNANNKSPEEYRQLNLLGLQAHKRVLRGQPPADLWFHQTGNLELATTPEEVARIEQKSARLSAWEYPARLLTPSRVKALEPALAAGGIKAALYFPAEGWIDTVAMCWNLLRSARAAGAEYLPFHRVTKLTANGKVEVQAADGDVRKLSANAVILAAGNGNRRILATAGIDFPIRERLSDDPSGRNYPTAGIISTTGPIESGLRRIVHAPGIALRPAANGGVLFSDSATGGQWDITDPKIWTVPELLLRRARQYYPALDETQTQVVTLGTRVLPNDGLTIADWVDDRQTVYAVATHSGVTLSAHLADVISNEVLTGQRHESLTAFGLDRFGSQMPSSPAASSARDRS